MTGSAKRKLATEIRAIATLLASAAWGGAMCSMMLGFRGDLDRYIAGRWSLGMWLLVGVFMAVRAVASNAEKMNADT